MAFRVVEHESGDVLFECEDVQSIVDYIEKNQPWDPKDLSIITLEKD